MACEGISCFYITGHGIDESLMKNVMKCGRDFFNLPMDKKVCISLKKSTAYRGYIQQGNESIPVMWLAAWADKMALSCTIGIIRFVPQEMVFFSILYWPRVRSRWLDINRVLFYVLWTETQSRSINTQKKNEANVQPYWPYALLINHADVLPCI